MTPQDHLELALAISNDKIGWAWKYCECGCGDTNYLRLDTDPYTLRLIAWPAEQEWWRTNPRGHIHGSYASLNLPSAAATTAANIAGIVLEGDRDAKGE